MEGFIVSLALCSIFLSLVFFFLPFPTDLLCAIWSFFLRWSGRTEKNVLLLFVWPGFVFFLFWENKQKKAFEIVCIVLLSPNTVRMSVVREPHLNSKIKRLVDTLRHSNIESDRVLFWKQNRLRSMIPSSSKVIGRSCVCRTRSTHLLWCRNKRKKTGWPTVDLANRGKRKSRWLIRARVTSDWFQRPLEHTRRTVSCVNGWQQLFKFVEHFALKQAIDSPFLCFSC